VLSEVLQCILTATHQQDIPLRSRPRLQVREAAYVLKKVVEDYVVRRNGRDGADWPLRVVFSVIHFIWLYPQDTRTIMIQVSSSIVPDDSRIIRQAINTNGGYSSLPLTPIPPHHSHNTLYMTLVTMYLQRRRVRCW
jgi:hypothetical protein